MHKPFLIYLLFSLFFISGLILAKPQLAYADISFISPPSKISLTHDQIYETFYFPDIRIYSPERALNLSQYIIYIWHEKQGGPQIDGSGNCFRSRLTSNDKINLVTKIGLKNCYTGVLGQWHIRLAEDRNTNSIQPAILETSFEVVVADSQLKIVARDGRSTVGPNEEVKVNIINTQKGKDYTFWWLSSYEKNILSYTSNIEGSATDIPAIPRVLWGPVSGRTEIPIKGQTETLCVVDEKISGYFSSLNFGGGCEDPLRKVDFTFSLNNQQPSASSQPGASTATCALSSQPALGDALSIDITGLTPSTDYRIVIAENTTKTGKINGVRSGTDGKIPNYILFTKTPAGNYKIEVIDVANKSMCAPISFSVGAAAPTTINKAKGVPTPCGRNGVATAIGCIETTPADLIKNIFTFFVGIAGGIAFLTMLYGGFKMMVSRGEPQALANAKQLFTSAIIGLLFVVFAILLLQIIGADILALPGFSSM